MIPNTFLFFKGKCCHNFRKGDPPHNPKIAICILSGQVVSASCSCVEICPGLNANEIQIPYDKYQSALIGKKSLKHTQFSQICTVEPRFNEPLFNEVLDITNDILGPSQSYSKMYGIEPRYNEPRYNEFLDITNIFRKTKRKIYLDITKCNVNTREKINAEQINSQQIF